MEFESYQALDADEKLNVLFNKIDALEQIQVKVSDFESVIKNVRTRIDEQDSTINTLTYRIIDIETRNRNRNLLIYGYRETKSDVCDDFNDFIYDCLQLDPDSFCIENVERLGRVNNQRGRNSEQKRTILVTFRYAYEVDTMMKNEKHLAGTSYAIDRDYSPEIRAARKRLWPLYKQHRLKRRNKVQLKYPAALIVNDRIVCDEFPGFDRLLKTLISRNPQPGAGPSMSAANTVAPISLPYQQSSGMPSGHVRPQQQMQGSTDNKISSVNTESTQADASTQSSQSQSILNPPNINPNLNTQNNTNSGLSGTVNIDNQATRGRAKSRGVAGQNRGQSISARAPKKTLTVKKAQTNQKTAPTHSEPPTINQQADDSTRGTR
ncbi:hypothetical protein DPMN_099373 [Dreissena polymorpha]|uniref:Uncharacterized protein n=1 Tax=Dreissena polymorpha TaxID=45954 RepID=A0A9D4LE06_DREPO|nr:hypothetical protein DPMN_099373 [Dreissena polymorpha]